MKILCAIYAVIMLAALLPAAAGAAAQNDNKPSVAEYNRAIEAYRSMLDNKMKICFIETTGIDTRYEMYLYLDEAIKYYYVKDVEKTIFTVFDIDNDGLSEMILRVSDNFNGKMFFKYDIENDVIYGEIWNYRVGIIKKDGTLFWVGAPNYIYKLEFSNGKYTQNWIAYLGFDYISDVDWHIIYYINAMQVSEEEYNFFWNEQRQKEDADWYEYNAENIAKYLALITVSPQTGDNSFIIAMTIFATSVILFSAYKSRLSINTKDYK